MGKNINPSKSGASTEVPSNNWQEKYRERHRLRRISDFPQGIAPPRRVRIYQRQKHYVLQWWEREAKKTLSERVDGDFVEAISRARKIDQRLENHLTSGRAPSRISHSELVDQYVLDLERRADAGEIDVATVARYRSALAHYIAFVEKNDISRKFPWPGRVNREFRLAFEAFLNQAQVSSNGCQVSEMRPMRGQRFVLDVVRGMYQWATASELGKLLASDFPNPFAGRKKRTTSVAYDPLDSLDINMEMAVDLINESDQFQLSIFAPLVIYGLRPGELGWIFREQQTCDWLSVSCLPELNYMTKGRRNKQFPLVSCISQLWNFEPAKQEVGLIVCQRDINHKRPSKLLLGKSLSSLAEEYNRRCGALKSPSAADRRRIRNRLMREAGQLSYDYVENEFGKLTRKLNWPSTATLKDLRHLFSTSLENAGMPEYFRRYFMGQSFGHSPIVSYTHLTAEKIQQHFEKTIETELRPLVNAIEQRILKFD